MTAPMTRTKPKKALDQRASSRHDGARCTTTRPQRLEDAWARAGWLQADDAGQRRRNPNRSARVGPERKNWKSQPRPGRSASARTSRLPDHVPGIARDARQRADRNVSDPELGHRVQAKEHAAGFAGAPYDRRIFPNSLWRCDEGPAAEGIAANHQVVICREGHSVEHADWPAIFPPCLAFLGGAQRAAFVDQGN